MRPTLSIRQTGDQTAAVRSAVARLTGQDVLIGVPAEKAGARQGGINNAELSYIHEFGAPAAGIPARPHLIPGIEAIIPEAAQELRAAASAALEGKEQAVDAALNKVGMLGQNAVRAKFQDNDWPPLKKGTLDAHPLLKNDEGKVLKDKKGNAKKGKSRREQGKINPLLVTGQLMKSHTYVIRKRGGGGGLITPTGGGNGA